MFCYSYLISSLFCCYIFVSSISYLETVCRFWPGEIMDPENVSSEIFWEPVILLIRLAKFLGWSVIYCCFLTGELNPFADDICFLTKFESDITFWSRFTRSLNGIRGGFSLLYWFTGLAMGIFFSVMWVGLWLIVNFDPLRYLEVLPVLIVDFKSFSILCWRSFGSVGKPPIG